MSQLIKDMTGMRVERLTVMRRAPSDSNGNARWHCKCDCGNVTITHGFSLRNGAAKSCGCYSSELLGAFNLTHGQSKSTEWTSWAEMKARCFNPNNVRYHRYGGRGITVCPEWVDDFERFLADMGYKPTPKHTIERTDNNKGYSKDNCVWATRAQQNNNKADHVWVVHKGVRKNLMQAVRDAGSVVKWRIADWRINNGWPVDKAVSAPPRTIPRGFYAPDLKEFGPVLYNGKTMTVKDAVAAAGNKVQIGTARSRLRQGWSLQEAITAPPNSKPRRR